MDVTPLVRKGQQIIQSYAGGQFKVSGRVYTGPILVQPDATIDWAGCSEEGHFAFDDFHMLTSQSQTIDVALFGTGSKMQLVPPVLKQKLKENGIVLEVMDTGAACRTYNVLMAEGRRVAALLLPVKF